MVINGKVLKYDHELRGVDLAKARRVVAETVEYAHSQMGDGAWDQAMNPEIPKVEVIPNPYTYTDWEGGRG